MTIVPSGIVFDARDVPALADFWRLATGYQVVESGEWFAHLEPEGTGLKHVFIQRVPEDKSSKNACHVDFETDDREKEVARLVAGGATRVADHSIGDFHWAVLQDPEGNEFCMASPGGE